MIGWINTCDVMHTLIDMNICHLHVGLGEDCIHFVDPGPSSFPLFCQGFQSLVDVMQAQLGLQHLEAFPFLF